ncbi:MAG: 2-dehydropantoate 2-reductase, partial [Candidatus Thermoplasmatota archaeon]|nr:2-dehydropantoate 2-reductase [Candidatus Thermoplasmatota archaeon]
MGSNKLPVWIQGQGALGTYLAVRLAQAGHPVTVRSGRVDAPETRELAIAGRTRERTMVEITPHAPDGPLDLAILTTRAAQAVGTAKALATHLHPEGALATVQNGLVALDVPDAVGHDRVVAMIIGFNAAMVDASTVQVTSPGGITLGALGPGAQDMADRLA